jgi:hypothetical protein
LRRSGMTDLPEIPEPQQTEVKRSLVRYILQSLNEVSTGLIALAAATWYGFLWITYNQFYEPLGITPSDVGLNYATILANSVGAAVAFLIPLVVLIIALITLAVSVRFRGYRYSPATQVYWRPRLPLVTRRLLVILGLVVIAFLVYTFPVTARKEAQKVIDGRAVSPLHAFASPAPILTIHADPVIIIKSVGAKKAGEIAAVESLAPTSLLYMGQANGMIVLYDSSVDQAIYLPASSVLLTVKVK